MAVPPRRAGVPVDIPAVSVYKQQRSVQMKRIVKGLLFCITLTLCFATVFLTPTTTSSASLQKGQITGSGVYMRQDADAGSAILCKLAKGTVVSILQFNVNAQWDKIQYNGKTGYVNRVYVSFDNSLDQYNLSYRAIVTNVNDSVTLRSLPSTSAAPIGTAQKNTAITVLKHNYTTGWDQVGINGKIAYVSSKYLSIIPNVDNAHLTGLTVSGGTMLPAFSPFEYGYVVKTSQSDLTISAKANSGVSVDVNGTQKSSATVSVPSGSMKTVRIKLNGVIRYSLYITHDVLTVGTWNIKQGNGNLPLQGRLVNYQQPDILGLQEVAQYGTGTDNLASLKTANMPYTQFGPALGEAKSGYGNGLLSRYPMSNFTLYKLDSGGYEQRVLMKANVTINGKKVSVYDTHFTWETDAARASEFNQIIAIMNKDTNKYKILFGDFNAQEPQFSVFSGYTVINTGKTVFMDDFGSQFNNIVIDNIIVTKNINVVNTRAIQTSLSDHNPVFAYLVLN
jgi:endonuclease/exonuclease/phosphatase family metal-dependent hydrolase